MTGDTHAWGGGHQAIELPELPNPPRGRIAPGSTLDTRDQLALYREQMGREATIRQIHLTRKALAEDRALKAGRRPR